MSPELRQFLTEWLAWAEADAPNDQFDPGYGLCSNVPIGQHQELCELLSLDPHPFNSTNDYYADSKNKSHHRNPKRLAWVRQILRET